MTRLWPRTVPAAFPLFCLLFYIKKAPFPWKGSLFLSVTHVECQWVTL